MPLHLTNAQIGTLAAELLVCPPWLWLSVRTKQFLQAITRCSIPFSKRTIWLIKILALIIGAGSVFGILLDVGAPWFVAIVPASIVVVLSLRENVSQVIPVKPMQETSAHESAWLEYRRLRSAYKLSVFILLGIFLSMAPAIVVINELPQKVQIASSVILLAGLGASIGLMTVRSWQWSFWPCPRCGCSFRGRMRMWLPKKCVYCGLPRNGQP
jgi:hypothetical protein